MRCSIHGCGSVNRTLTIEQELAAEAQKSIKQRSLWSDALYRFMRNKAAVISAAAAGSSRRFAMS